MSDPNSRPLHGGSSPGARRGSAAIELLRWAVGLGALAWVLRLNGGWRVVQLPLLFPGAIAAMVAHAFLGGALEAQRLRLLCAASVAPIPFWVSYRLVSIATLFNMAIPGGTGGDVLKLLGLAHRVPGKRAEFTAVLLLDRMIGLSTILILALAVAGMATATGSAPLRITSLVIAPALILMGAVVFVAVAAGNRPRALLLRLVPSRWKRLHGLLRRAFDTADLLRQQPRVLVHACMVSILAQGLLALAFAASAYWLVPDAPPLLVPALAFIALTVNAIPITPGGIGVGEAAFEGLFQLAGYSGGARLLLFWRLGQLPFAILGAWFFSRERRLITDRASIGSISMDGGLTQRRGIGR